MTESFPDSSSMRQLSEIEANLKRSYMLKLLANNLESRDFESVRFVINGIQNVLQYDCEYKAEPVPDEALRHFIDTGDLVMPLSTNTAG